MLPDKPFEYTYDKGRTWHALRFGELRQLLVDGRADVTAALADIIAGAVVKVDGFLVKHPWRPDSERTPTTFFVRRRQRRK